MMMGSLKVLCIALLCLCAVSADKLEGKFPDNFEFGCATSSYQIEGGWNSGGRGESVWDEFSHREPSPIVDGSNGDIACDSFNNWREDIQLLKNMGVDFYRFSISWSRIIPKGRERKVNARGIKYYSDLIDGLIGAGIRPMVTLFHWDTPLDMDEAYGGWLNNQSIRDFEFYAGTCFKNFGDRVKEWITFNEPWVVAWIGHGVGVHAPGQNSEPSRYPYLAAHNMLRSHAKAYRLYERVYKPRQHGNVGITLNADYGFPANNEQDNVAAAHRAMQFRLGSFPRSGTWHWHNTFKLKQGWFAEPIFGSDGDYPEVMRRKVKEKSTQQGLAESRLPAFTEAEKRELQGSSDFFGLNHYTSVMVENRPLPQWTTPSYENDMDVGMWSNPSWPGSGSAWLKVAPDGMQALLNWIKNQYGNPNVIITENGFSDNNGTLNDDPRIDYFTKYLNKVQAAINDDGCNVTAYTAWSLMDNYEWASGYSEMFGIHYVNFSDPTRPRTPKKSARWYKDLIAEHKGQRERSLVYRDDGDRGVSSAAGDSPLKLTKAQNNGILATGVLMGLFLLLNAIDPDLFYFFSPVY